MSRHPLQKRLLSISNISVHCLTVSLSEVCYELELEVKAKETLIEGNSKTCQKAKAKNILTLTRSSNAYNNTVVLWHSLEVKSSL